jgi:HTH-type transcriptional regulator/antitoxin MqsA
MNCPICGAGELVRDTRDRRYAHKGKSTTIQMTGDFCDACGGAILDKETAASVSATMLAFNRKTIAE